MKQRFKPKQGSELYDELPHYAETRRREISGMVQPYIKITNGYFPDYSEIEHSVFSFVCRSVIGCWVAT